MDFWELTKLMFRRWYFSVPMLVIAAVATVFTASTVKPDYKATGHLQLLPPVNSPDKGSAGAGKARNPWSDLGEFALGETVTVTVRSQASLDAIKAKGLTDNFTMDMDGDSPIITIEAIGKSPEQAIDTVREVVRRTTAAVENQQQPYHLAQGDAIVAHDLDDGGSVEVVQSAVRRAMVVVLGVGILLTAGVTIGLDALLRRRAATRALPAGPPIRLPTSPRSAAPAAHPVAGALRPRSSATPRGPSGQDDSESTMVIGLSLAPVADRPANGVRSTEYGGEPVNGDSAADARPTSGIPTPLPDDSTIVLPLSRLHLEYRDGKEKQSERETQR